MKLKVLIKGLDLLVKGSKEIEVTGLSSDSRTVAPGNLFIAKRGGTHDGSQFIGQAVNAGAAAVVTDIYDPFLGITQIIHPNVSAIEAKLAAHYYGLPSEDLFVVGVTGTKGKTTTTYLIKHLLDGLNVPAGLMGTVETIIGEHRFFSTLTTHDVIANQKWLKEMVLKGCKAAVLEVSSHGLAQGRVEEIGFDVGVFTNLYPDHLDYHPSMDEYAATKKKLFEKVEHAILNADSPWAAYMGKGFIRHTVRSSEFLSASFSPQRTVRSCKPSRFAAISTVLLGQKILPLKFTEPNGAPYTFGIEKGDLRASDIVLTSSGTSFSVDGCRFHLPLIGRFNIYNALAAIAVGLQVGAKLEEIRDLLATFGSVPARLERIGNVFIDFAHNGEALENVLQTLKEIAKGRVLVVFGCGGNRDPGRRSGMARAAEKWADISIVTSDNPRQEDPNEIAKQIVAAFRQPPLVELDRKKAIALAIEMARADDLVLIAGKGHERVQIFAHQIIPFDDTQVVKEILHL